jgi:hypothetical protein
MTSKTEIGKDILFSKYIFIPALVIKYSNKYRGTDKSLAQPSSRIILCDDENISFDASLVIYI